jgi:enoyl-CoA hydratase
MSIDLNVHPNGIWHVLLNKSERMNALDIPAQKEFCKIWEKDSLDVGCKVIVLSGSGEKAFCVGSDIKEMQETGQMVDSETLKNAIPGVGIQMEKPVISALHGYTVGMGLTMAIHSDFRFALSGSKFSFPEVKHGMLSGISAITLPGLIGEQNALDLMLSGRIIDGTEAIKLGLINKIIDGASSQDVLNYAMNYALELSKNSSEAMRLTKRLILANRNKKINDFFQLIDDARKDVTKSSEFVSVVQKVEGMGRM